MTTTQTGTKVLKQDSRGRVRVPRERREALLVEFEKSGLSGVKFAALAGIKYATFANWVQRQRKQGAGATDKMADGLRAKTSGPVRLFEAVVEGRAETVLPTAVEGLLIELPGGSRVRVGSPLQLQLAAELVGLVAQRERVRC